MGQTGIQTLDPNASRLYESQQTEQPEQPAEPTLNAGGKNAFKISGKVQENIEVPTDSQGTGVPPEPTTVEKTSNVADEALPSENPGEDAAGPSLFATAVSWVPTAQNAVSVTVTALSSLFLYRLLDKNKLIFGGKDAFVWEQGTKKEDLSPKPKLFSAFVKAVKFTAATVIGTTLQTLVMSKLFSDSISFRPASNSTYGKNFAFTAVLFLLQEGFTHKSSLNSTYFKVVRP